MAAGDISTIREKFYLIFGEGGRGTDTAVSLTFNKSKYEGYMFADKYLV